MSAAAAKRTVFAAASILALVALSILVPVGGASSVRRDNEPPTTPRNVRVAGVTQSLVRLAWDPSTDNVAVEGYYVFGDKGKATLDVLDDQGNPILDDDGKPIGDAPGFTVTWLGCGESTELTVIAFDASQNRSGKATVTVSTAACGDLQPPTAPSGFTQVATSTDSVVLAWAASTDNVGVVEYGVNRNLQRVATPTQPTVTLTGLSCGSSYEYAVDAADAAGNRSPLATAYVQTAPCPSATDTISPSTPTGLAASNITQTALALNWNASSDNVAVTGYDVYRNGTKVASVTSTSASQSGLSCATSYPFAVRARDGAGRTSAAAQLTVSTAACSTTPPPPTDTISPSTPTGLAASNIAQSALALNWNASSDNVGVTGYDVYRNGARVASVTSTSVDQSTLSCGTSYPFAVRALDGAGRTSAAAQLTVSTADCSTTPPPTDTTPPSTPTGLAISSATRTSVSLTWNPATDNIGVAGYRLYVDGSLSVTTTQPATTVSNLSCGTTYTFAVDALDAAGNNSPQASVTGSSAACADTQAPSAPTNVVASSRSATSIALSWSASSDSVGVAGYGLYRGGVEVGSTSTTTGIFAGLTCNTNYTLAVDAYDAAGNRSAKTTVMVSTTACPDTTPPTVPSGLAASNVSQTSLTLTWNASTDNVGVTGYDVYRNATKMANVSSPTSSQTGLACGTAYTFGVVALDAAGNSSPTMSMNVSTSACPPPPPPPATGGTVIFDGGWDTGDTSQWSFIHRYTADRFRAVSSDGGVTPRKGSHMARVEVRGGEPASWDASMNVSLAQKDNLPNVGLGKDVYMGWSVYIPGNFSYPTNGGSNLMVEWHADASMQQAPFHFGINGYTGQFFVDLHTAATGFSPVLSRDLGPLVTGRWVDCVVRTKWAQDASGIVEFWMDGVKRVSWTGRTWGTQQGVYPTAGYYRANYNATAVLYLDALKVGTSYDSVAP